MDSASPGFTLGSLCDEYRWERNPESGNAGYGITSVLEGGTVLEKAAANVSVINGTLSPERAQAMSERGRSGINMEGGDPYSAVAMSLVFHSAHPFIPTLRADVRMFKVGTSTRIHCKTVFVVAVCMLLSGLTVVRSLYL